jgi:hypothetical protein
LLFGSSPAFLHWNDTFDPWGYVTTGGETVLALPRDPFDISSIILNTMPFATLGFRNVSLYVEDSNGRFSLPAFWGVTVKECLPHVSSRLIYPYGRIGDPSADPFQMNHTCCDAGGSFAGMSRVCFSMNNKTCYPLFSLDMPPGGMSVHSAMDGTLYHVPVPHSLGPGADANDLMQRSYTQRCANNRGNVCAGDVTDSYSVYADCPDTGGPNGLCVGPCNPSTNSNCGQNACRTQMGTNSIACYNYTTGQTFNFTFLQSGLGHTFSGECNKAWTCAIDDTTGVNTYNSSPFEWSNYSVQAGCDGKGTCTASMNIHFCPNVILNGPYCRWYGTHYEVAADYPACNPADTTTNCSGVQAISWSDPSNPFAIPACLPDQCCDIARGYANACYDPCTLVPAHPDCTDVVVRGCPDVCRHNDAQACHLHDPSIEDGTCNDAGECCDGVGCSIIHP